MTDKQVLIEEFGTAVNHAIEEYVKLFGHPPTGLMGMIKNYGAYALALRLVANDKIQYGFERLAQAGRKDLTMEGLMLEERFKTIFLKPHRDGAQYRLDQV